MFTSAPNVATEVLAAQKIVSGTNYSSSTDILDGTPVARDVSQSDTDATVQATKRYNGIAKVTSSNAKGLLGIAKGATGSGTKAILAGSSGEVVTAGLVVARVRVPANVAIANGDHLYPTLAQDYLQPYNLVANSSGSSRVVWNGGFPFAIARQAVDATSAARTLRLLVELPEVGALDYYCFQHRGTVTADYPSTPASNFSPLCVFRRAGEILAAGLWVRSLAGGASAYVNLVLDIQLGVDGTPASIFSTTPRIGAAANLATAVAHKHTVFDYDANLIRNGVIDTAANRVAGGTRAGYSLDYTSSGSPTTEPTDVLIELWVRPDGGR
jgi:hypothetical protein